LGGVEEGRQESATAVALLWLLTVLQPQPLLVPSSVPVPSPLAVPLQLPISLPVPLPPPVLVPATCAGAGDPPAPRPAGPRPLMLTSFPIEPHRTVPRTVAWRLDAKWSPDARGGGDVKSFYEAG